MSRLFYLYLVCTYLYIRAHESRIFHSQWGRRYSRTNQLLSCGVSDRYWCHALQEKAEEMHTKKKQKKCILCQHNI